MFQGDGGDEPLGAADEKVPELGFSWEMKVLGHLPMPSSAMKVDGRFREIHAVHLLEAPSNAERDKLLALLVGSSRAEFTTRDVSGKYRKWPKLNGGEFRGAKWTMSNNGQLFIASFHIIPMHWMVSWFQRDVWEALKARWAQKKFYEPPALGQTFMAIYERTMYGVQVHRPLYPDNRVDAMILEEHRKSVQK
ncbi:hypothetical protein J4E86_001562 [Alternaria arbusti]|uniref:uncharacterized protein n=1 Tax=Alternaria arbusti TaxID=232088 RepID=UPI00221F940B|nr:uncharacterized protein J4E86_001562 [Alternaria arbusti]KAI4959944.1 hypothetical protein J4E86_001562 [Alternaria arbusti]